MHIGRIAQASPQVRLAGTPRPETRVLIRKRHLHPCWEFKEMENLVITFFLTTGYVANSL